METQIITTLVINLISMAWRLLLSRASVKDGNGNGNGNGNGIGNGRQKWGKWSPNKLLAVANAEWPASR